MGSMHSPTSLGIRSDDLSTRATVVTDGYRRAPPASLDLLPTHAPARMHSVYGPGFPLVAICLATQFVPPMMRFRHSRLLVSAESFSVARDALFNNAALAKVRDQHRTLLAREFQPRSFPENVFRRNPRAPTRSRKRDWRVCCPVGFGATDTFYKTVGPACCIPFIFIRIRPYAACHAR